MKIFYYAFIIVCLNGGQSSHAENIRDIDPVLEPIRYEYNLPALTAAVVLENRLYALGAVGFRKNGSDIEVTKNDSFHLGSCTKAFTGTLIGILIETGKLRWDTTLSEAFPALAKEMNPEYRTVTVRQLLAHRGGFPSREQTWPYGKTAKEMHRLSGSEQQQRFSYVRMMLAQAPYVKPGTAYVYSNAGYAVLGALAETVAGISYEDLVTTLIFRPLDMNSAGFGPMGLPDRIDQPWQHSNKDGDHIPINPVRHNDNPPILNPAGTIHSSMADWSKFIIAHLDKGSRHKSILTTESFENLHTPAFDGDYSSGWKTVDRKWGGGKVLTHTGTNGMNFAVVWMAPKRDFAVLVATNSSGKEAEKACDKAANILVKKFLLN